MKKQTVATAILALFFTILSANMAFAQRETAFARCVLKTTTYPETYEFFGKPHSNSSQVYVIRNDGTYSFRAPAQTAVFGNQAEYQRINFFRNGIPVEIIFSRLGNSQSKQGTLYLNGRVERIVCQELYEYQCSCYAGRCQPGCYGQ